MRNPCTREFVVFHGYKVYRCGTVLGKKGQPLKAFKNPRKGGGFDLRYNLFYAGKSKKWLAQRLVAACFLGPIDGYQIDHIDRDTFNNHVDNLERVTQSQNQKRWRKVKKK